MTHSRHVLTALACVLLVGCGGGASDPIFPSLSINPISLQLQGSWDVCDPAYTNGVQTGSDRQVVTFGISPIANQVSMAVSITSYNSLNCTGAPSNNTGDPSVRFSLQGGGVLPDATPVEKVGIEASPRFGPKQVIKLSSKQLVFGDTSKPLDANGYPTVLQTRSFNKL